MKKFLLILLSVMMLTGCEFFEKIVDAHYPLFIINNTKNKTIFYTFGTLNQSDTLLPIQMPKLDKSTTDEEDDYHATVLELEYNWKKRLRTADTVRVYFFRKEAIDENEWDVVRNDYLVWMRYDLTKKDLDAVGWLLPFPPDERMKDIKMYPPYEEAIKQQFE